MKTKLPRKKAIPILVAIVLIGVVVAIAIGYGGDLSGTVVDIRQDSPLPPPTDTPKPATSTFSPTPIAIYSVRIGVTWYDASGNPLSEPPEDLPADFRVTAKSEIGEATCAYSPDSSNLMCQYSSLAEDAGGSDDLLVPSRTAYTVEQSGMPAHWRTFAGVGLFYSAGSSPTYIHTISNRASRAPTATPVPPTNTPASAPAQAETSTPTPPSAPPPPPNTPTPSSTPEATSTPRPATATPTPPTSTPTDVPPTSTPTDIPPTATPTATDVPPTSPPTDVPPTSTPTDVPPTATPEPTATPKEPSPTPEPTASSTPTHTLTPSPTPARAAQAESEAISTPMLERSSAKSSGFLSGALCLCMGSAAIVVIGFFAVLFVRGKRKRS